LKKSRLIIKLIYIEFNLLNIFHFISKLSIKEDQICMRIRAIPLIIPVLLLFCAKSPTGPEEEKPVDNKITLSTTPSSDIATIVRTPDKKEYEKGESVVITVTPKSGYTFTGWSGDISLEDDSVSIVMNSSKTVYANFKNSSGKTVFSVITSSANGSVTLSPSGGVYDSGTTVFLYARPDYGFLFSNWDGAVNGESELDSITITKSIIINANFTADPKASFVTLNINPVPSNGKIILDPQGIVSGDTHKYKPGTAVSITVEPDSGFEFYSWGADYSTTSSILESITDTLTADRTVSAKFIKAPDGINWTKQTSGVQNGLISVIQAKNQIVIAGNVGTVLTSPDGVSYTLRTTGVTSCLNCVIWTGNMYMCVGDMGTILTSTDAITWNKENSTTTYHLQSVVWTGKMFIAVGGKMVNSALNYNCILTSTDGKTWKDISEGSGIWYSVAWNGKRFVSAGYDYDFSTVADYSRSFIKYSDNGTTWEYCSSDIPIEASFTSIIWTGSDWVAVGGSRSSNDLSSAYVSKDGDVWEENRFPTSDFMNSVTWTGNNLVAAGEGGSIYYSIDGTIWEKCTSGTTDDLFGVTWTGTQLIAVGYGGLIMTSP
jgi:uncharacterized repeat protein (TIGR02543 family)